MNTKVFKLFADCIPVAGFKKATICDLGRGQVFVIPKSLYHFIEQFEGNDLSQLMENANDDQKEIIIDYLNHLENQELIFWCDQNEAAFFPKIKPKWQSSSALTNAIIEFNPSCDYSKILIELNTLGCAYYQFRLPELRPHTLETFYAFAKKFCQESHHLNAFEILAPHYSKEIDEQFSENMKKYIQLKSITFYNHLNDAQTIISPLIVKYTSQALKQEHVKGAAANFFPSYSFFFESKHRHTFYNQKVSIDFEGSIKNGINDIYSFGSVHIDSITAVINTSEFKKIWYAAKDKVKVCQDCEFKYVCFDTRPLTFNEADQLYESAISCDYDPYIGEWTN